MRSSLDKYEIITPNNVKKGDLILYTTLFGGQRDGPETLTVFGTIKEITQFGKRLRARVDSCDYFLDDALVITSEGKLLLGRNLYNRSTQ